MATVQQEIRLRRQNRNMADREMLMHKSHGPPAKAKAAASVQDLNKPAAKTAEQK